MWRGGSAIFARAVLQELEEGANVQGIGLDESRVLWLADSFTGVPAARDPSRFSQDDWLHVPLHEYAVSLQRVQTSFEAYSFGGDQADDRVRFLPGFFNETLSHPPAPQSLSFVRIDADSYESTADAVNALYPSLNAGGVLIIDDWHLNGARKAILEHRLKHRWDAPLLPVPEDYVYGCRQGSKFGMRIHTTPAKPVQGAFAVMRKSTT